MFVTDGICRPSDAESWSRRDGAFLVLQNARDVLQTGNRVDTTVIVQKKFSNSTAHHACQTEIDHQRVQVTHLVNAQPHGSFDNLLHREFIHPERTSSERPYDMSTGETETTTRHMFIIRAQQSHRVVETGP